MSNWKVKQVASTSCHKLIIGTHLSLCCKVAVFNSSLLANSEVNTTILGVLWLCLACSVCPKKYLTKLWEWKHYRSLWDTFCCTNWARHCLASRDKMVSSCVGFSAPSLFPSPSCLAPSCIKSRFAARTGVMIYHMKQALQIEETLTQAKLTPKNVLGIHLWTLEWELHCQSSWLTIAVVTKLPAKTERFAVLQVFDYSLSLTNEAFNSPSMQRVQTAAVDVLWFWLKSEEHPIKASQPVLGCEYYTSSLVHSSLPRTNCSLIHFSVTATIAKYTKPTTRAAPLQLLF